MISSIAWFSSLYQHLSDKIRLELNCSNQLLIAKDFPKFDSTSNTYSLVKQFSTTSIDELIHELETNVCHFYEVIRGDRKMILNFDLKLANGVQPIPIQEFSTKLIAAFGTIFEKTTIRFTPNLMKIYNSSNESKCSYHVILKRLFFSKEDCLYLCQAVSFLTGWEFNESVYKEIQMFRIVTCSKWGKTNFKELWDLERNQPVITPRPCENLQFELPKKVLLTSLASWTEGCQKVSIPQTVSIVKIAFPNPSHPTVPIPFSSPSQFDLTTINSIEELVRSLVLSLSSGHSEEYDRWFNIACILKSIGDYRDLFHEFSRKSSKYDFTYTDYIWDQCHGMDFTLGSLFSICDIDQPGLAARVKSLCNHSIKGIVERNFTKSDVISELGVVNLFESQWIHELPPSWKRCLMLKSPMGTGKTTAIREWLVSVNCRVVAIVSRQTLASKLKSDFPGFVSYLDPYFDRNAKRIICSIDSLWKLLDWNFYQEAFILLLDEVGGIFSHLISNTISCYESIKIFKRMIQTAEFVLATDATMKAKDVEIMKVWVGKENVDVFVNTFSVNKPMFVYDQIQYFNEQLCQAIQNGNVIICCNTKLRCKSYYNMCVDQLRITDIAIYTGDTSKSKKNKVFANPNEYFKKKVVIYNSTANRGISVELDDWFDDVFGEFSNNTLIEPEDCLQLPFRSRKSKRYHILLSPQEFNACRTQTKIEQSLTDKKVLLDMKNNPELCQVFVNRVDKQLIKDEYYQTWVILTHYNEACKNGNFNQNFIKEAIYNGGVITYCSGNGDATISQKETDVEERKKEIEKMLQMSDPGDAYIKAIMELQSQDTNSKMLIERYLLKVLYSVEYADMNIDFVLDMGKKEVMNKFKRYKLIKQETRRLDRNGLHKEWFGNKFLIESQWELISHESVHVMYFVLDRMMDGLGFDGLFGGSVLRSMTLLRERFDRMDWITERKKGIEKIFGKKAGVANFKTTPNHVVMKFLNGLLNNVGLKINGDLSQKRVNGKIETTTINLRIEIMDIYKKYEI